MMPDAKQPPDPTREAIEAGTIREEQAYEFKTQVDLGQDVAKRRLVDDVVAFLNAGASHMLDRVSLESGEAAQFVDLD